ncbi:hypothetical protein AZE42_13108 [Rhizopogon vesiculosus]|uniref:Uncharacterized protein n=1 Tax=Rhizopogon vesiculosus TaxID=180088 RepID=A0A1J8QL83_9AGAM|nr:hypothetical protein AZE42_13108 [Rhizopogon vesiculosus]
MASGEKVLTPSSQTYAFQNRYFALGAIIVSIYLDVQTNPVVSTLHAQGDIGLFVVVNIEIILLRRLFIIYEYKRAVVVSMVVFFIAAMGATLGLSIALSAYSQTRDARFMKVLARDSFVYFACNFLNYLLITLILQIAPPEFFTIGASWTIMIPPITANHLLINMEYSRFANTGTNSTINANTFSSVEFNDGVESTPSSV